MFKLSIPVQEEVKVYRNKDYVYKFETEKEAKEFLRKVKINPNIVYDEEPCETYLVAELDDEELIDVNAIVDDDMLNEGNIVKID